MKHYELGSTEEAAPETDNFYTVADCIENSDWNTVRELAHAGDDDAVKALQRAEDE